MSSHLDTLYWFRANPSLLFLLNAAYLTEKQKNTNFIVFGRTRLEHEPMSTHTLTFTPLSNCRYYCLCDCKFNAINMWHLKNHYFIVGPVIPHSSQDQMSCGFKFLISLTDIDSKIGHLSRYNIFYNKNPIILNVFYA